MYTHVNTCIHTQIGEVQNKTNVSEDDENDHIIKLLQTAFVMSENSGSCKLGITNTTLLHIDWVYTHLVLSF